MLTLRQIRNRGLREMGVVPERYQFGVGRYDVVELVRSEPDGEPERLEGWVEDVEDHGWYRVLTLTTERGADRVTVWRDGPPDWGVVELVIVKKLAAQLQPHRDRR